MKNLNEEPLEIPEHYRGFIESKKGNYEGIFHKPLEQKIDEWLKNTEIFFPTNSDEFDINVSDNMIENANETAMMYLVRTPEWLNEPIKLKLTDGPKIFPLIKYWY